MKLFYLISILCLFFISTASASEYCIESISKEDSERFIPPHISRDDESVLEKDFPSLGVKVKLDWSLVSFTDSTGHTYPVTTLNSGDDYNGWHDIYELENNWLYIYGVQYNHAIHLILNAKNEWENDKIVRIYEQEGIGEKIARFILGVDDEQIKRDHLTSIVRVKGHPKYSEALHKLFYPTSSKEFRDGEIIPFDYKNATTYAGDIPRLKVAFFKNKKGQLYSYDGKSFQQIINGKVEPLFFDKSKKRLEGGIITDVENFGRAFYAVHSGIYKIIKKDDSYELEKILLPENSGDLLSTQFIPTPDKKDIAILTRGNIFLLSTLEGIFPRKVPDKHISITGSDEIPALIPQLGGILFNTGSRYIGDKTEYFYLLKKCN